MKITVGIEVEVPSVPNYLLLPADENRERQKIHISEIPAQQLEAVADMWKVKLLSKAKKLPNPNPITH